MRQLEYVLWALMMMTVFACSGQRESAEPSSSLHGVALNEEYILRMREMSFKSLAAIPPHLRYIQHAPIKELRHIYAFEVCALDEHKQLMAASCFNPFHGRSGPLVINLFSMKDMIDPVKKIGQAAEAVVDYVSGGIDVVRDHPVPVAVAASGLAYGACRGMAMVEHAQRQTYQRVYRAMRSVGGVGAQKARIALEKGSLAALDGMSYRMRAVKTSQLQRRAVQLLRWQFKGHHLTRVASRFFATSVFVAGAAALVVTLLPQREARIRAAGEKALMAHHVLQENIVATGMQTPFIFDRQRLQWQERYMQLHLKHILAVDVEHIHPSSASLEDIIPALAMFLDSYRIADHYNTLDIISYCLPERDAIPTASVALPLECHDLAS